MKGHNRHKQIVIIDHNDSFTYNLVHLFNETNKGNVAVITYNKLVLSGLNQFDKIVLGPGPGLAEEYPHFNEILDKYGSTKSLLGICLGHQAIGQYFDAKLTHLPQVLHGQKIKVYCQTDDPIFSGIETPFDAGLYHSWVIDNNNLPASLIHIAHTDNNLLMAFRHKTHAIYGLQFHPESYMTPAGKQLISNWLML